MTWRKWTGVVVAAATTGLVLWDFIATGVAGSRGTISNPLLSLAYRHPVIPLFMGGLMTHLFWPGRTWGPGWLRVTTGALVLAFAAAAGLAVPIVVPPAWPLAVGLVIGRALVPQAPQDTRKKPLDT
jgi:peptidoglycan/LPS O-acetylase OafA/YrhL